MSRISVSINWEIAPFYRRFQGWGIGKILWWLWPIRWYVETDSGYVKVYEYFCDFQDALAARDNELRIPIDHRITAIEIARSLLHREPTTEETCLVQEKLDRLGLKHITHYTRDRKDA